MAKLENIPDRATIIAWRGLLDFYFWKGLPVARAWPRKSTVPRTAREINSSLAFAAAATMTGALDPIIVAGWKEWIVGTHGVTWVDGFRAAARAKPWFR